MAETCSICVSKTSYSKFAGVISVFWPYLITQLRGCSYTKVLFCFCEVGCTVSSCLSPFDTISLLSVICASDECVLWRSEFCEFSLLWVFFVNTPFMWHVAALRKHVAHAQREIAELRDVREMLTRLSGLRKGTCRVSVYNSGRWEKSCYSPLKRSGNYTYREVEHMKHCRAPDGACVCPVWYLRIQHSLADGYFQCLHLFSLWGTKVKVKVTLGQMGNRLYLYILVYSRLNLVFRGLHSKMDPN